MHLGKTARPATAETVHRPRNADRLGGEISATDSKTPALPQARRSAWLDEMTAPRRAAMLRAATERGRR